MDENYDQLQPADAPVLTDEVAVEQDTDDSAAGRRGRPRDPRAQERDDRVKTALGDGSVKTREQLATELGMEGNLVYLSLWRLRRAGEVEKTSGEGAKRAWRLVGAEV